MAPSLAPLKDTARWGMRSGEPEACPECPTPGSAGGRHHLGRRTASTATPAPRSPADRRRGSPRHQRPRRVVGERDHRGHREARLRRRPRIRGPRRTAAPARVLLASHRSAAGVAEPRVMSVAHRSALRRRRPGRRAEARRRGVIAMGHCGARRGSHPFGAGRRRPCTCPHGGRPGACRTRTAPAGACPATTPVRAHQSPPLAQRGRVRERRPPGRPSARLPTRYACDPSVSADRRAAGSVCSVGGTALPSLGTKLSVRWPSGVWPVGAARSRFAGAVKWPCPTTLLARGRPRRGCSRRVRDRVVDGAGAAKTD